MDLNRVELKLELAKARGMNEGFHDEMQMMKDQFLSEIRLLEETIQMQNEGTWGQSSFKIRV